MKLLSLLSAVALVHVLPQTAVGEEPEDVSTVTEDDLDLFREKQGIKKGYKLKLQKINKSDPSPSVTLPDGTSVSLSDDQFEEINFFSPDAECFEDGDKIDCPVASVFKSTQNGYKLLVAKDSSNGDIQSVTAKSMGGTKSQSLQAVAPGILTDIPQDASDPEFESHFILKDAPVPDEDIFNRNLRGLISNKEQGILDSDAAGQQHHHHHRRLENRAIELAIAVESSFCAAVGGKNYVDAVVERIVGAVSFDYEQEDLGFTVVVSHYEKYCRSNRDPYRRGVNLNRSGCGTSGLLQFFQDYWNNNRAGVRRDMAQLFSGTGLECDAYGCVIGCAYVNPVCVNPAYSYGVNYVSYTANLIGQSNLVSHEMGHVLGSYHDEEISENRNFIMYPSNSINTRTFSTQSVGKFLASKNEACITVPGPTPSPPPPPPPSSCSGLKKKSCDRTDGCSWFKGSCIKI